MPRKDLFEKLYLPHLEEMLKDIIGKFYLAQVVASHPICELKIIHCSTGIKKMTLPSQV